MDDHLLIKYLRKQCDQEESAEVDYWLSLSQENKRYFNELKEVWTKTYNIQELANPNIEEAWDKLEPSLKGSSITRNIFILTRVAAAVLLVILATAIIWYNLPTQKLAKFTTILSNDSIRQIVMSDSSVIWLNKHSCLKYSEKYGQKTRNVELMGEAFFKVHRNPAKPFIIETKESTIKVLGTSFNVNDVDSTHKVQVAVVTGKVSFADNVDKSNFAVLTPNQVAELEPGIKINVSTLNSINNNAWLTKKLTFRDQPLFEVFKALETFYHIKINIADSEIGNVRITAIFDHQTVEEVISIICTTTNLKYKQTNTCVTITK